MSKTNSTQSASVIRPGKPDAEERIRQSNANVRLEGLTPNPKTQPLILAMAKGSLEPESVIKEICSWYTRRT